MSYRMMKCFQVVKAAVRVCVCVSPTLVETQLKCSRKTADGDLCMATPR